MARPRRPLEPRHHYMVRFTPELMELLDNIKAATGKPLSAIINDSLSTGLAQNYAGFPDAIRLLEANHFRLHPESEVTDDST